MQRVHFVNALHKSNQCCMIVCIYSPGNTNTQCGAGAFWEGALQSSYHHNYAVTKTKKLLLLMPTLALSTLLCNACNAPFTPGQVIKSTQIRVDTPKPHYLRLAKPHHVRIHGLHTFKQLQHGIKSQLDFLWFELTVSNMASVYTCKSTSCGTSWTDE